METIKMSYKTISGSAEDQFVEKKSRFIGYICHTETEEEAVAFINEIRAMHRKATHNCYAYMLRDNNTARHSDDGEPGGTAGVPIYEVLRKEGLVDVTCVVTRYFGGIKLGEGGLVRAYTQGAKIAVEAAEILNMCAAARLCLKLDYSLYGKIGKTLTDFDVRTEKEDFGADVEITLCIRTEDEENFSAALIDLCNGSIVIKKIEELEYNFG